MSNKHEQSEKPQKVPLVLKLLMVLAGGIGVVWLLLPSVGSAPASRRELCCNNLKHIALALQNYHQVYGCFPPAHVDSPDGKPMHSWRVLLLPFLDYDDLYKQYDLAEPWDGPHNSRLRGKCPSVYRCPLASDRNPSATSYLAVVGAATLWPGGKSPRLEDIRDGMSNTIGMVEVADSDINWMEPRDMGFDQAVVGVNKDRQVGISSNHSGGANVSFVDGSVRYLPESVSPAALKALLTIAGGETVEEDQAGNLVVRPPATTTPSVPRSGEL